MRKTITFLILLLVAQMSSSLFAQNLDEGFEGALFPPKGWTVINKNDPNGWVRTTYANYVISGSAAAYIKKGSLAYSNWLITPRIMPTEGDETISFNAKNIGHGQYDAFNVKLSTTGTAEEDFNVLLAKNVQTTQISNKYEYDLSPYRGQNVYVAIQAIIGSGRYLSIDDFAGPALRPHSLDAAILSIDNSKDFIGLRDIVVSLQNNGTTDLTACTISYSVNGSTPTIYNWTGLLTQDATEQVTIAVDYDFQTDGDYLIEATVVLDGDEVSHNNSQTKTLNYYGAEPLPYFEGFEYGHTNGADVANWWQESLNGSDSWRANSNQTTYNRAARTGNWNAFLSSNNTDWMFSPKPMYLEAEKSYEFNMYARIDEMTAANISVAYGAQPNSEAMTNTIVSAANVTNGDYQKIIANITPTTSGYYFLAIKGEVTYPSNYLLIDDISIKESSAVDAQLTAISYPKASIWARGVNDVKIMLRNQGLNALNAAQIQWSVDGIAQTPYNWTGALAYGENEEITIGTFDFSAEGAYKMNATVVVVGDDNATNNVAMLTATLSQGLALPFFEGFEEGHTNASVIKAWTQQSLNGSFSWMAGKNQSTYNRAPYTGEWNASLYQNNTDWMFSPKPIYLEADENYTFSMYARTDKMTGANISVAYGTDPNSEAMQNAIVAATEVANGDYQKISAIFIPTASGYYYLGIKGQVGSSNHYLSIDDIALHSVYILNYAADANGSITGEALQAVGPGANGTAVTAVANVGYHFVQWSDGVSTNPRTDIELSADLGVVAQFAINSYTIAVSAGENGEITPTTDQVVEHGSNASFSITPNEGFYLASVLVNGKSVGLVSDYSFDNISSDHSVNVTFTDTEPIMHVLTSSAEENGSISPSGEVAVAESGDVTFSITANPGCIIKDVLVNGTSVGSVSSYTFENISATHSIVAEFENFNALHFDGTDDYVSFPALPTSMDLSQGFSFAAWVKWDAFTGNERIMSLGNGTSGHSDDILLRTEAGNNRLIAELAYGGTNYNLRSDNNVVTTDAWYHVALTINPIEGSSNSDITIYLNGAAIKSASTTRPRNIERTKVWLGRSHWTGDSYFKGSMNEVSFWSKALTSSEIVEAMKVKLAGTETGLIGYYRFNQGVAGRDNSGKTTLKDASSFNRSGTLNNFALTGASSNWVEGYEPPLDYMITASNGHQGGGNTVTITTTNSTFGNGSDINSVTVGGVAAGITEQTATSVSISLPPGSEGVKDIVIVSESVGSITLPGAYSYNPAGMINEAKLRAGGPYISGGDYHSMALKADGSVAVWGHSNDGLFNVPAPNSDYVAVSAGDAYCLALKADGTISGWGRSLDLQANVPGHNSNFVAISAADIHSLGLKADGSVLGWGAETLGQTLEPTPNSNFVAVAAGYSGYSLGLKDDGRIVAWGRNDYGQTDVPSPNSNFVAMAAGHRHALGLKDNGTIVAWGNNSNGQLEMPVPNSGFVAIAAGAVHSLGLKADGSIVAWGNNDSCQLDVPTPNADFVAIATGSLHSLGLKADGTIVSWGSNNSGQLDVPDSDVDYGLFEYGVTPSYGVFTGGSEVVINGTNLGNGTDITEVTLCDVAVQEIVSQSATQIVVRVGAAAVVGRGDVRVVSTSFGETVKPNAFTYQRAEQAPLVFEPESPQPYRVKNPLSTSGGSGTGAVSYRVISGPGTIMNGTELYVSKGSGTILIQATKAQDGLFYATSATATVQATRGAAVLTLRDLEQSYDGTPKSATVTTNPSGMPVDLTYDGSETAPTEIGSYTVVATVDLENWVGSATGTLVISLAEQTIDFPTISDQIRTDVIALSATASSGLSVSFEVVSGPAVIDGDNLSFTGIGTVVITASQAGNQYWNAAPTVTHTFLVSKATLTATAENKTKKQGEANPVFTVILSGFVLGDDESMITDLPIVSCTADISSAPGDYPITISGGFHEFYDFTYVPGTLTIVGIFTDFDIDATNNSSLSLYPNPTKDKVYIKGLTAPAWVEVYSMTGEKVITKTLEVDHALNLHELPNGLYLLKVEGETFKLVINSL